MNPPAEKARAGLVGVLGRCICKENEENYMRPCYVHAPSDSERELAADCLAWAAGEMAHEPRTCELLSKASAVIDRQVARQDALISVLRTLILLNDTPGPCPPLHEQDASWEAARALLSRLQGGTGE